MQAAGLVERTRNPADERQVFVELTERMKAPEERATCLGPAVFGDTDMPVDVNRRGVPTPIGALSV